MTFTHALSINNYGSSKFIVSASAANGTHTTIAAALTSASSGDTIFIRPGTYTEDLTLKANVNLTAYVCDAITPNVTITGKCSYTGTGNVTCSGIKFLTNGDNAIAVSGAGTGAVFLENCVVVASNATGISVTNAAKTVTLSYSTTGQTDGFKMWDMTAGALNFFHCNNANGANTVSTVSGGLLTVENSFSSTSFTLSSTAACTITNSSFDTPSNSSGWTFGGSGVQEIYNSFFRTENATPIPITIGTGTTLTVGNLTVSSANATAITEAGASTLVYSGLAFPGTGSTISVTTQTGNPFLGRVIVAGGGTGLTSATAYAILCGGTTSTGNFQSIASVGTSGQVLTSNGPAALPTFQAASSGTWSVVSGSLTNSQVKNLHGTPVQVIAAPGSGKTIEVLSSVGKLVYGGNNAFTAGASQTISLFYGTSTNVSSSTPLLTNSSITATVNRTNLNLQSGSVLVDSSTVDNVAINLYNPIATEISGNAANDNTVSYNITYRIVTI